MLKKLIARISPADLLVVLLIFHLIGNSLWIKLNNTPPAWDEAAYSKGALLIYQSFQEKVNFQKLAMAFADPYGPFIKTSAAVLNIIFSPQYFSFKLAQLTETILFIFLLIIIYKLAVLIFQDPWVGLGAAFFFSFYQAVYDYSRWLLLDIPLMLFILLAIYFLIKSHNFTNRKYSLLAFLSFALTTTTKFQGSLFLIVPAVYAFIGLVKNFNRKKFINFLSGLGLYIAILGFWILNCWQQLQVRFTITQIPEPFTDPTNLIDPTTWLHNLKLFIDYEITFIVFIPFLIALFFYLKAKDHYKSFILVNIIFCYFLFSFLPNKDIRYLFPIFPFTAMIFAKGVREIFKKKPFPALFMVFFVGIFNLLMYLTLSYGWPIKKGLKKEVILPYFQDLVILNLSEYPVRIYNPSSWPQEKIINDLIVEAKEKPINIVYIPNYDNFNENNFNFYLTLHKIVNINFVRSGGKRSFASREETKSYLDQFDYFLFTPDEVGVFYQIDSLAFKQIQEELNILIMKNEVEELNDYLLPTGQKIILLKRLNL